MSKTLIEQYLKENTEFDCQISDQDRVCYHIVSKKFGISNFLAPFAQMDFSITFFWQGKAQQLQRRAMPPKASSREAKESPDYIADV